MKIVKNSCYGGYSLSLKAIKMLAELKGKKCYFFDGGLDKPYKEISLEEAEKNSSFYTTAFTVQNPEKYLPEKHRDKDGLYATFNKAYSKISLEERPEDRTDKDLIEVVEKLGKQASGRCAKLEIVEIPDGVEYEIDEYDGIETIREKHRTW